MGRSDGATGIWSPKFPARTFAATDLESRPKTFVTLAGFQLRRSKDEREKKFIFGDGGMHRRLRSDRRRPQGAIRFCARNTRSSVRRRTRTPRRPSEKKYTADTKNSLRVLNRKNVPLPPFFNQSG